MALTTVQAGILATPAQYTAMKNRIINGAMVIDQRNAGASTTITASAYTLDRWQAVITQASKFSVQQNAGSVTSPVGFTNYLGVTSSSAYSVTSTDAFLIAQYIEGFNTADLGWGTVSAKTVTLSFQVYSSLTGTFGGSINNAAFNRNYLFSYSIPTANTWTTVSITIAGDTTGTWVGATNGVGIAVRFGLGSGSTYSGTANTWQAGNLVQPTGSVSVVGTSGATFYITGVQLEVGSSATGYEYRQYQQELALCQRYYQVIDRLVVIPAVTNIYPSWSFINTMRTIASLTFVPDAGSGATFAVGDSGFYQNNNHSTNSGGTAKLNSEL